jgi:hypothetical protein
VGPIVFSGYCYELIELNSKQPGTPNPPFQFNRFVEYLLRGVWPFLIQLICQFLLQPPAMALYFATVVPGLVLLPRVGPQLGVTIILLGVGAYFILVVAMSIALALVLTPLMLRAGLAQDFVKAFDFKWIVDFNRRVWLDLVLIMLFITCTAAPLALLGEAMCIVGLFPMMTIIQLMAVNLSWQLYNLYLARGGTPIPLKPPPEKANTTVSPVPPPEPNLAAT